MEKLPMQLLELPYTNLGEFLVGNYEVHKVVTYVEVIEYQLELKQLAKIACYLSFYIHIEKQGGSQSNFKFLSNKSL